MPVPTTVPLNPQDETVNPNWLAALRKLNIDWFLIVRDIAAADPAFAAATFHLSAEWLQSLVSADIATVLELAAAISPPVFEPRIPQRILKSIQDALTDKNHATDVNNLARRISTILLVQSKPTGPQ